MARASCPRYTENLDFDEHVAVFDFQRIHGNFRVRVVSGFPCLWIPGPGVPGADHFAILDHALAYRATAMKAYIVHRGEDAIHVGHADGLVAAWELLGLVGAREVGFSGQLR